MSKISMTRPRYIALHLAGEAVSRRAFGNAIRDQARREGWKEAEVPQLTRFLWPHAIVRVEHDRALDARAMLPRVGWAAPGEARRVVTVQTLGTSGTILALTTRLRILAKRDAPGGAEAPGGGGAPAKPRGGPGAPGGTAGGDRPGGRAAAHPPSEKRPSSQGKPRPRQA